MQGLGQSDIPGTRYVQRRVVLQVTKTHGGSLAVLDVAANARRVVPAPLQALAEGKATEDYDVGAE